MSSPRSPSSPPPASRSSGSPTREELQRSLERLHEELAGSAHVDAESRTLLREVLADIRRLLDRDSDQAVESAPRRLGDLAVGFEARHPVLAGSIRQFVDLLGRAGL